MNAYFIRGVDRDWAPLVQKAVVADELKQAIALALQRSQAAFVSNHALLLGVRAGRRRRLSLVHASGRISQAQGEQEGA